MANTFQKEQLKSESIKYASQHVNVPMMAVMRYMTALLELFNFNLKINRISQNYNYDYQCGEVMENQ